MCSYEREWVDMVVIAMCHPGSSPGMTLFQTCHPGLRPGVPHRNDAPTPNKKVMTANITSSCRQTQKSLTTEDVE